MITGQRKLKGVALANESAYDLTMTSLRHAWTIHFDDCWKRKRVNFSS